MHVSVVISAIVLGFTGSFHCVGMCGPIALAVPIKSQNDVSRWLSIGKYLVGKTFTYVILGMMFGLFGRQIIMVGFQQTLSIILGILLLIIVTIMITKNQIYHTSFLLQKIGNKLIPIISTVLQNRNSATPFLLGMLNGLLPCGLVYLGLLGAVSTGTALSGGIFMFGFGIGTIPVMFSFLALAKKFSLSFREKIKKASPYFIAMIGLVLILRGMHLNIPFVSPDLTTMQGSDAEVQSCHP